MSFMTDVYYKPPANPAKEAAITDRMIFFGGRLDPAFYRLVDASRKAEAGQSTGPVH